MKQVKYDVWGSWGAKVDKHPEEQMELLGFKVIAGVPQSISDSWWFTVEDYDFDLPSYITPMEYNFEYWHGNCRKDCEYFKKSFDTATQMRNDEFSCCGGSRCLKK